MLARYLLVLGYPRQRVRLYTSGDEDALKLLYLRHRERVYRFVRRLTNVDSLAAEVVNEVFLSAWGHAGCFKGKSQVVTLLVAITQQGATQTFDGSLPIKRTLYEIGTGE